MQPYNKLINHFYSCPNVDLKTTVCAFELLLTKASVFSQLKDSNNAIKYFRAALNEADKT